MPRQGIASRRTRQMGAGVAVATLAVATVLSIALPARAHADTRAPSMSLAVGYGSLSPPLGSWVPVNVALRGGSADFSGDLLVSTGASSAPGSSAPGFGGSMSCVTSSGPNGGSVMCSGSGTGLSPASGAVQGMTYRVPLDLTASVDKRITVTVQLSGGAVHAELRSGSTVLATADATPATGGRPAVAVVADSHASLDAVQGIGLPQATSDLDAVQIAAADLPDDAAVLRPMSAILLDGAATGSLTAAQRAALTAYVAGGGAVVITTGTLGRQATAGLPAEILPATITGSSPGALPPVAVALSGLTGQGPTADSATLAPSSGSTVSERFADGRPFVIERGVGMGSAVEVAVDPGVDPIASWGGQRRLLADLLARAVSRSAAAAASTAVFFGPSNSVSSDVAVGSELAPVLTGAPGISLPSATTIGVLLMVYVLLAGPVSYIVLTRLRRRELMWVSVPALAVVCALGAYWTGLGTRGATPLVSEVRIIHLGADGGPARVDSYAAVWTPRGGDADIALVGGGVAGALAALPPNDGATTQVDLAAPPALRLRGAASASLHGFSSTWEASSPAGGISEKLHRQGDRLVGTVTNHLGVLLRDVAVGSMGLWGQQTQNLGTLADGASADVSLVVAGTAVAGGALCGGPYGCGSGPPDFSSADTEARRDQLLAEVLWSSALGSGPSLTGIAERPVVGSDIGGDVQVETLEGVEVPLTPAGPSAGSPGTLPGRLLARTGSQSTFAGPAIFALQSGDTGVYDYVVPTGAGAATVTVSTSSACGPFGGKCIGPVAIPPGLGPTTPPAPGGATTGPAAALDILDPATGTWTPVSLHASGADLAGSLPAADLAAGDLLLRVTAMTSAIPAEAPAVVTASAGGPG